MKLTDFLNTISDRQLNNLAQRHRICYEDDFSHLWATNKLKEKLLSKSYLEKLINKQLSTKETNLLKQLITTEFIAKKKTTTQEYHRLKKLGLIYEKDNFYYLPEDIKEVLTNNLKNNNPTDNCTVNNQEPTSTLRTTPDLQPYPQTSTQITVNRPADLTFYHYLLLTLNQIKTNATQQQLISYLSPINFTSFSTAELLDYLLQYSQTNKLITTNWQLTSNFTDWLETDYSYKILHGIDSLFPQSKDTLRQIIAVLSHQAVASELDFDFITNNLQLNNLNTKQQNLLQLLDSFNFSTTKLTLTARASIAFSNHQQLNHQPPQINQEEIIVDNSTSLSAFWEICQSAQLVAVDNQLVFKSQSPLKKFR
ncbi:hypothetical protein [Halanaerobaculum tunisiense]